MHRIMVEPRPGVKYLFLIGVIALNYHTGAFENIPLGDDNVVVAMFTEITERKRSEEALSRWRSSDGSAKRSAAMMPFFCHVSALRPCNRTKAISGLVTSHTAGLPHLYPVTTMVD